MFESSVIVANESLSCAQCEKMDLKNHTVPFGKGFKYAEDAGKLKNVQKLGDFSEEQQTVELLRTNAGLMNNYHNTEKQSWVIQETKHDITIKGSTFEWGHFYKFSYYLFL